MTPPPEIGDERAAAQPPRRRPVPAALARVVVLAGLSTAAAGVWVLTSLGWGLIAVGAAAVVYGLLVMDVDR